ncbi:hypothetical protein ACFOSV_06535 [Algoriphagus namhaensis]|uniref:Uncharacterized protein n=1 Tax=Algoriphagus namhaensis TaxID=915353 RepID=A0ABV8ASS9_9BACT
MLRIFRHIRQKLIDRQKFTPVFSTPLVMRSVNITDNESRKYASVKFDLEAMSNDPEIQYLLKIIIQKSVAEAGYKDRIFKPRLTRIIDLIEEEINQTADKQD